MEKYQFVTSEFDSGEYKRYCRVLDGSCLYRVYYSDTSKHYDEPVQGTFYECLKLTKIFASHNNLIDDMRCQIKQFYKR